MISDKNVLIEKLVFMFKCKETFLEYRGIKIHVYFKESVHPITK